MEWISVKDRLPKEMDVIKLICEKVLIYHKFGISIGWNSGGDLVSHDRTHNVTHWMPLPEPPKEEL